MVNQPLRDIITCPCCHHAVAICFDGKIRVAKVDLEVVNDKLVPVIDLPEKAKRTLTEEELIERERETNRMWKELFENEKRREIKGG